MDPNNNFCIPRRPLLWIISIDKCITEDEQYNTSATLLYYIIIFIHDIYSCILGSLPIISICFVTQVWFYGVCFYHNFK